jgi:hypothetical protein
VACALIFIVLKLELKKTMVIEIDNSSYIHENRNSKPVFFRDIARKLLEYYLNKFYFQKQIVRDLIN